MNSTSPVPQETRYPCSIKLLPQGRWIEAARKAAGHFQRVFRDRQAPEEAPVTTIPRGPATKLTALLVQLNLAPSKSEAERLIKHGGVEIDGGRVDDSRKEIDLTRTGEFLLRAGKKKFLRVVVE